MSTFFKTLVLVLNLWTPLDTNSLNLRTFFQTLIHSETLLTSSHISNFLLQHLFIFHSFFPSYDLYFLKMAKNTLHLEKKPKYYQKILTENSSLYTGGRVYGLGKIPSGKSLSFCASIFTPESRLINSTCYS